MPQGKTTDGRMEARPAVSTLTEAGRCFPPKTPRNARPAARLSPAAPTRSAGTPLGRGACRVGAYSCASAPPRIANERTATAVRGAPETTRRPKRCSAFHSEEGARPDSSQSKREGPGPSLSGLRGRLRRGSRLRPSALRLRAGCSFAPLRVGGVGPYVNHRPTTPTTAFFSTLSGYALNATGSHGASKPERGNP